jgi:hypothetical protein
VAGHAGKQRRDSVDIGDSRVANLEFHVRGVS